MQNKEEIKIEKSETCSRAHGASEIKQNMLAYRLVRGLSKIVSAVKFKRKFLRNEIKGKDGPMVVIANHEAALDFVTLIGATKRPMSFVISASFYKTIPLPKIVSNLGMIPKQQFQTTLGDIHNMKAAIDEGKILVIYPAGLMSDDGNSTPIPEGTFGFLKWLKADVYMAKNIGTYFSMPKWRTGGIRGGRTYTDIYKLFDKDELAELDMEAIKNITLDTLRFDAYDDQEKYLVKYQRGNDIRGIENVLYECPHCKTEFSMKVEGKSVIRCEKCGFAEEADKYGFFKKISEVGEEVRHASKWSKMIKHELRDGILAGESPELSSKVRIQMIDESEHKYVFVGDGELSITGDSILLKGKVKDEPIDLTISMVNFASLPFKPGVNVDIQDSDTIYRCYPEDGRLSAKFVNTVEILYKLHCANCQRVKEATN
jgi:ribosomal protein L37AE/L43A